MSSRTFSFTIANSTPLADFANTLSPGDLVQYPLPSLADSSRTGSYPFDAPAAARNADIGATSLLDWASMMDHDPVTRRWYISGGRPYQSPLPLKMVIFDELANEVRALDQWSGGNCGHLYRSTTVIPEHRRVAYAPHGGPAIALLDIDTESFAGNLPDFSSNIGGFTNSFMGRHFLVWFPGYGAQGSLIHANASRSRVIRYDWATGEWFAIGNFDGLWENRHFDGHMHPLTGKMILGASTAAINKPLAILDNTGNMTLTAVAPCTVASNSRARFFPHPHRDASIAVCNETNKIWTYEWSSDTWVDRGPIPQDINDLDTIAAPMSWGALFFKYGSSGTTKAYAWKPGF